MLYWFLKPLAQVTFIVFFRKFYYLHEERMPKKGPVIMVVNHPTAFLDPIVYPTYGKRAAHNVLRGDMFSTPFSEWLCKQIKTIPIFRFRDGFENMRKNQEIMERITQFLNEDKVLSVMVEGSHEHVKRLRTIQKGAARIAFDTYVRYGRDDIQLVPLGVNYTDSDKFRSVVMAEFGEPILLKDYIEIYKENEARAVKLLTAEIGQRLRQHIVHIERVEDEAFVNMLLDMNRNNRKDPLFPLFARTGDLLQEEIALANYINDLPAEERTYIREDVESYQQRLARLQVEDVGLARAERYNFGNTLLLIIGFLPFLLGYVLNYAPLRFAKWFADKKVKKIEFHSSIRFGVGTVGYFLYFLLLFIIALVVGKWWSIAFVLAMPLLGFIALFYMDLWAEWKAARKVSQLPIDERNSLQQQRATVLSFRKKNPVQKRTV